MIHLQMIAAHYEEEPESFNDEIRQLDQLREVGLRVVPSVHSELLC